MNKCELKHVCFKDLEDYLRKDDYFSSLNSDERALIRKNLGIVSADSSALTVGSHSAIYNLAKTKSLIPGARYVIENFQSIYKCNNLILGLDTSSYPSKKYTLVLLALTDSSFDTTVKIYDVNCSDWDVRYDIRGNSDIPGNMGTITYLRDSNNNYAYYDFKNIRFYRPLEVINIGKITYALDQYLLTFSIGNSDISNTEDCKNNHLEKGCYDIVCLGTAQNNTFEADSHNLTFFDNIENNKFYYGTRNVKFLDIVRMTRGAVHDKTVGEITAISAPKEFNVLEGVLVIVYLDAQTQTYQLYYL